MQHKTQVHDVRAPFTPDDVDMRQVLMLRVFRTLPGNTINVSHLDSCSMVKC